MRAFKKVLLRICVGMIGIGILLIIIGFSTGAGEISASRFYYGKEIRSEDMFELQEVKKEPINSIKIGMAYGTLTVQEGDNFSVEGSYLLKEDFKNEIENGVWKLGNDNIESIANWGFRNWSYFEKEQQLIVTIPKDFEADELQIRIGAGKALIEKTLADKIELQVGAGELIVEELIAANKLKSSVGAGSIKIKNADAANTTIQCGVGQFEYNGILKKESTINCGIGQIQLDLTGKKEDYSYSVNCGIGEVKVGDNQYNFVTNTRKTYEDAIGTLSLKNGIGSIRVTYSH